jgi:hypothetical protein
VYHTTLNRVGRHKTNDSDWAGLTDAVVRSGIS